MKEGEIEEAEKRVCSFHYSIPSRALRLGQRPGCSRFDCFQLSRRPFEECVAGCGGVLNDLCSYVNSDAR
jgi:hypothetical protein